jgi:hypothetical protein
MSQAGLSFIYILQQYCDKCKNNVEIILYKTQSKEINLKNAKYGVNVAKEYLV